MTSDAKIGLLLGLVFIFVIAFVINGLPSLRPPTMGKADVMTISGEGFEGVGGQAEAVPNWDQVLGPPQTGVGPAPVATEPPKPAAPETPQASLLPTAGDERMGFSIPLSGIGKLLDQLPQIVPPNRGDTFSMDTPKPAPEQPASTVYPPVAVAPPSRSEPPSAPKPGETLTKMTDLVEPSKPATVASKPVVIPGSKTYVVVAGDNLPTIAKKMYGLEEGNRLANIDRIFQANLDVLKSPAEVKVGQKIVIPPPLPKPATTTTATATAPPAPNPNKPSDMLPKTLFEKVESLGRRAPVTVPPPIPDGRWYTVQDGDNLWKIAVGQLGAGSRWDEIHKLNAEILTSQDSLQVGMRLRLPAK